MMQELRELSLQLKICAAIRSYLVHIRICIFAC